MGVASGENHALKLCHLSGSRFGSLHCHWGAGALSFWEMQGAISANDGAVSEFRAGHLLSVPMYEQ